MAVLTVIAIIASIPEIDVAFNTDLSYRGPVYSTGEFDYAIHKKQETGFSEPTSVCFRVENKGENLSPLIAANNFLVGLETNAIQCDECSIYADMDVLESQGNGEFCKRVLVSDEQDQVHFKVLASWTTWKIPSSKATIFTCEKTDETDYKADYHCKRN